MLLYACGFIYGIPEWTIIDMLYVLFDSLSGGELFDRIADDNYKMTEAEVIKYIRQVVDALQHMHEKNMVHLDIKVQYYIHVI